MPSALAIPSHDSTAEDYWYLLKPRVMSLVVFTGIAGLLLAPGFIHPFIGLTAILCLAVGSGAAGAINMWYERDIDALMGRTKGRPLPQGKIQPGEALGFGLTLAIGSVIVMYTLVNFWAAFYLMTAILFYVFVYTIWLKRRTPQNIVIGGAAGALPPVIGWAAVMNETSLFPWILFGIIFLWTPPHFWALALCKHQDYQRANIPMLPTVVGAEKTKNHILGYILVLIGLTLFPVYQGYLGLFYGGAAFVLGLVFLGFGIRLKFSSNPTYGMRVFFYSIFYLFLLFTAMIIDKRGYYDLF
ncbi:MAG: protoheme IX farnesyltransferase [Alphaproteobacteria bacterium]|nr:protoheme IX farnesyltransferase [Alphaproteobacteria bacterium]